MKHNVADFELTVDGQDFAGTMRPRLVSLTLTEKIEGGADELEIVLTNHDGQLAPIKRGVFATLRLGWKSGEDVTLGLVDKGKFKVDQVVKQGPPDQVRITARSADLTGGLRKRKDKGWKGKTLGAIVEQVARDNGLEPRVHADLKSIPVPAAEQAAKSDIAFVRDLGRRHDAVATIKDGKLLFMPIGADTTAGGKALPQLELARRASERFTFTIADREDNDGAEATWHDKAAARKKTVTEGAKSGQAAKNPRRIKRSFASEGEAKAAARAEARRASRGRFTLNYDLALGDAAIEPNRKLKVTGFDSEIDAVKWLIKQAAHTLDSSGFRTRLELESLA